MKKLIYLMALSLGLTTVALGQQSIVMGQTPSLSAQGDFTTSGAVDTTVHGPGSTAWTIAQAPLKTPLDTTMHTAKTADSCQEKIFSNCNVLGFQVDAQHLTHNATGADSTTITLYASKTGGNWAYPWGGWYQVAQSTMANSTSLQSFNFDVNSSGAGENPNTHYMIVVKVGELYVGTNVKWRAFAMWR